ncbi:MAG: hypothetical protein ACD_29C00236G0001 [uncultured bacterium]|nr:MAG: hypothetical protein ACD_29C00236G0001 [uncultured bacterium]
MPIKRVESFKTLPISSSGILEVLVASIAVFLAVCSKDSNKTCFAVKFSKIASIITSACAIPSPLTSGCNLSKAA